jgi:hypothetical protein
MGKSRSKSKSKSRSIKRRTSRPFAFHSPPGVLASWREGIPSGSLQPTCAPAGGVILSPASVPTHDAERRTLPCQAVAATRRPRPLRSR